MRFLLATLGSRGDVEPFLALALALKQAGHDPVLCASQRFRTWIEGWGVPCEPMDDGFVELIESLEGRKSLEDMATPLGVVRTLWRLAPKVKPLQVQVQRDLWRAAQASRPDAMVFHMKLAGAPDVAAALDIPAALLLLVPVLAPTGEFACPAFPPRLAQLGGARTRRSGYAAVGLLSRRLGSGPALAWRREVGLGERPGQLDLLHRVDGQPWPMIHAHSASLLPRPADWPSHAQVTGFLRLPSQPDWLPPQALTSFLDGGPPPVYVSFGSMSGRDPRRKAQQVIEGLRLANVRGIIGRGWGGLQPTDLPPTVLAVEDVPHDWLFPRMAGVVHHGGAGTTAAGLLAGRPTLACPFFGDQPFWGRRIHELGLGPAPIPQRSFNASNFASAVGRLVTDPSIAKACAAFGERLRAEEGGTQAVALLERFACDARQRAR
jgi:sterol 3beta-glucosyltransferase